jgi:hypothetical protein
VYVWESIKASKAYRLFVKEKLKVWFPFSFFLFPFFFFFFFFFFEGIKPGNENNIDTKK